MIIRKTVNAVQNRKLTPTKLQQGSKESKAGPEDTFSFSSSSGISPQRRAMGAMICFLSVGLGSKYPIAGLVGGAVGVAMMFGSED